MSAAPLTENRATRIGKGLGVFRDIIDRITLHGTGNRRMGFSGLFLGDASSPKWANPTRYDGKALREIRKRKGVGRPPAINLTRMPIAVKVNANQAWYQWAVRNSEHAF
jgi:hypothetical protein